MVQNVPGTWGWGEEQGAGSGRKTEVKALVQGSAMYQARMHIL